MEWNKIFAKQISDKGFKKYKKLTQLNHKKITNDKGSE